MSIDAVGDLVYRKYLVRQKKLRDLADARRTMTRDERRELLINTIIREKTIYDLRKLDREAR